MGQNLIIKNQEHHNGWTFNIIVVSDFDVTMGRLGNRYIWVVLFTTIAFALIGFFDDYLKIKNKSSDGLNSKQKIFLQIIASFIAMYYLYHSAELIAETSFIVPFFKDLIIPMSAFVFISTGMFVLIGSSNAVNLTDGLDGLAILPSVLIAGALGLIAYSMGNQIIADYLYLPHLNYQES